MVEWLGSVGKFRVNKNRTEANITKEQWVQHFSKLLASKEIDMQEVQAKKRKRAKEGKEGSVDKRCDGEISMEKLEEEVRGTKIKMHQEKTE